MSATVTLSESQPMAKSPKNSEDKKVVEMTGIRVEREVNELLRQGAAIRGETIVGYANRIMREYAESDILEYARKKIEEADRKKGKKADKSTS